MESKLDESRSMTSEPSVARTQAVQREKDTREGPQEEIRMVLGEDNLNRRNLTVFIPFPGYPVTRQLNT